MHAFFLLLALSMVPRLCTAEGFTDGPERKVHVEWGAGNYGLDATADGGEATPNLEGARSEKQYDVLYRTAEELRKRYGNDFVFYVNDIDPTTVDVAVKALRGYAKAHGLEKMDVRPLPGDFTSVTPVPRSDSAYFQNPEDDWFLDDRFFTERNATKAAVFQELANSSKSGLMMSTYFTEDFEKFAKAHHLRYEVLGEGNPYYYPNGEQGMNLKLEKKTTRYRILPDEDPPARYPGRKIARDNRIYAELTYKQNTDREPPRYDGPAKRQTPTH